MSTRNVSVLAGIMVFCICGLLPSTIQASKFKVLAVMSYEQNNPWCMEIKEGIDAVLGDICELTYFYMDTKVSFEGGKQKAKAAYSLFQKLEPDGVIAADDNAQGMFVLPYLKKQVNVPVMFCGVNEEAEKYGYPSSNVSGILERGHIRESIAFVKQLLPSIETVGFLVKHSPSGKALLKKVESESATYLAKFITFELVRTVNELFAIGERLKERCDALYVDSLEGITNDNGNALDNKEITQILSNVFDKPIIGANQYHVEQGALCAVVKTGQEQGSVASEMLLKAMQGTAVKEIPITRNYKGRRVINVTVMETLGIKPKPVVLLGTKLVRTVK